MALLTLQEILDQAKASGHDLESYKSCNTCDQAKPFSEFNKNAKTSDGYRPECRSCTNLRVQASNHGMEEWEVVLALTRQGNACAICKTPATVRRLSVDHDHDKVCNSFSFHSNSCATCRRDFLCGNCNTMLGMAKDSIATLTSAIEYLTKWG